MSNNPEDRSASTLNSLTVQDSAHSIFASGNCQKAATWVPGDPADTETRIRVRGEGGNDITSQTDNYQLVLWLHLIDLDQGRRRTLKTYFEWSFPYGNIIAIG